MGDGYQVSPQLLREASAGINATIGELKTLGITEAAEEGRGFGNLALSGMQIGNQDLCTAFSSFCDRWSWGVRTMVKEGNQIASLLGLSAGTYSDMETYAVGVFKDAFNAVAGDPHAGETVEQKSFGQIVTADAPNYSAASWQRTARHAGTTWAGVGRDVAEGPMGVNKTVADTLGLGQRFGNMEDQVFGPAPSSTTAK